jgi:hypothetical protein
MGAAMSYGARSIRSPVFAGDIVALIYTALRMIKCRNEDAK